MCGSIALDPDTGSEQGREGGGGNVCRLDGEEVDKVYGGRERAWNRLEIDKVVFRGLRQEAGGWEESNVMLC